MTQSNHTPRVSVVMSVFDGERYLEVALDSVLRQTFTDFELIVVDDGSTDDTAAILAAARATDDRVVVLTNPRNLGLTPSLNRGLATARGALIARMDGDDVSHEERLSRQVAAFDARPRLGLLGTAYHEIDADGIRLRTRHPPATDTGIRAQMLYHNALCHSAVMVRRAVLERAPGHRYDETLPYSQDVELWSRLLQHTRAANLPDPLVSLRKHPQTISTLHAGRQQAIATDVAQMRIEQVAPELGLSRAEVQSLRDWYGGLSLEAPPDRMVLCHRYLDLLDALGRQQGADAAVLAQCRRHHIRALLGRANLAQLRALLSAGVIGRMLRDDALATAQVAGARLVRRVINLLPGRR